MYKMNGRVILADQKPDRNKPGREKVRLAQVLVLSKSVGISLNL